MATESKTPDTDGTPIIAPCHRCGAEIPTSAAIRQVDDEGNIISSIAVDLCSDCEEEITRRVAERRVDAARRKAKYEKSLADLLKGKPKQMDFEMGLD